MKIRLIKVSDDVFDGNHPNGIQAGHVQEGEKVMDPRVGDLYWMENFHTSVVTEIIDETTFKTRNSTYRIETIE